MNTLEKKVGEIGEWLGTGTLNFFGRQFAGKDTQAKRLADQYGVTVIGGGDIMRNSTQLPAHIKAAMERGDLSPTDTYREIVLPYLGQTAFQGKPLILSAVGRMAGEEADVLATTESAGHPVKAVPFLDITEEESFRRMIYSPARDRADDTPAGLRRRLEEFKNMTMPVIDAYEAMGVLVRVDALPEEGVVFASLVHLLHERAMES